MPRPCEELVAKGQYDVLRSFECCECNHWAGDGHCGWVDDDDDNV